MNFSSYTTGTDGLHVQQPADQQLGIFFQDVPIAVPENAPLLLRVQLANTGSQPRQMDLVLRRINDWIGYRACRFTLPANSPLGWYELRTLAPRGWHHLYAQGWMINGNQTASSYQVRAVEFRYLPAMSLSATTQCSAPIPPTPIPTPTLTPSLTPSPTRTSTNTPTSTPLSFGIRFSNALGQPASSWSATELDDIQAAVQIVGEAFQIQMTASSPQDAFNRVMVNGADPQYIYFFRANGSSSSVTIVYPPELNKPNYSVIVNVG